MITSQKKTETVSKLEQGVYSALETYSNVHRGSGHKSMITTHLFEQARKVILEYLGLKKGRYVVIFCTPRRAEMLTKQLNPKSYKVISSKDIGLSLGVKAIAVKRKAIPGGAPSHTGGGTANLVSRDWVLWSGAPDKFEAGTPAIINVITFARALRLIKTFDSNIFENQSTDKATISKILYHDELDNYTGSELLNELRKTLIGQDIKVPTRENIKTFVNLDNSASTPTFAPIWNTFCQTWNQPTQIQHEIITEVKSTCANLLGAPQDIYDIIFTSNTTEAINLAAENLNLETDDKTEPVVLNTLLEHSSNDLPWRMVPNCSLVRLSVNENGFIDLNELETTLQQYNHENSYGKKRIKLVAISGASNVLGTCSDLAKIAEITHKFGAKLLVDAAQLVAHRKIDMEKCGIDYLAFSAHKVYAPFGCGVLVAKKGLLKFSPEERKLIQSSGDENVAGIAALGKAFVLLQRIGMDTIHMEEQSLTAKALKEMSRIPGIKIHGIKNQDNSRFDQKLGVIVFELEGMMGNQVAKKLSMDHGIGTRFGCHCAHIIIKHLLNVGPGLERFQRAMLTVFPKVSLPGLVRVSFSIENTEKDIDRLIQALNNIMKKPNGSTAKINNTTDILPKAEVQKQIDQLINDSARKVYSYLIDK